MSKRLSQILSSSVVLIGLGAVLLFTLSLEIRQWQKKRSVESEVSKLTQQQSDLEQKNKEISDSLSFLSSPDFKEKIAREQLNLQKEGEQVYDVPDTLDSQALNPAGLQKDKSGNLRKWYDYFFNREHEAD